MVTDGSSVLGVGDQGSHGIAIPIAKLLLYSACAGVHPRQTLPVMLDLGTDNKKLLEDPNYFGMRDQRYSGDLYAEAVDEFMYAMRCRYPNALIHFEDF